MAADKAKVFYYTTTAQGEEEYRWSDLKSDYAKVEEKARSEAWRSGNDQVILKTIAIVHKPEQVKTVQVETV